MAGKIIKEAKNLKVADTPQEFIQKHPIVEQMEKEWPQMTNEFKRLQREQYELFCRKQHDYGPSNISVDWIMV